MLSRTQRDRKFEASKDKYEDEDCSKGISIRSGKMDVATLSGPQFQTYCVSQRFLSASACAHRQIYAYYFFIL